MTTAAAQQRTISLAHSPDSDDAYVLRLATHKIVHLEFQHVLKDIQTLNEEARKGTYDVTAISFHAYAYISDKYALLPHGASIGDNYGPVVVANEEIDPAELANITIAVPGRLTSAFLALSIHTPKFNYEVVPFDQIIEAVTEKRCDAGLLIHEGQLFYQSLGLHKVLDLGEWWHEHTDGLPLPMGGNAIRRELGEQTILRFPVAARKYSLFTRQSRGRAGL
jgi:1,4-dihydroxy-6-naphthoate synthase